jgi:hypothetical protein
VPKVGLNRIIISEGVKDECEGGPVMTTIYVVDSCEGASAVSEGVPDPKVDRGEDDSVLRSLGDYTCFSGTSTFSRAVSLIMHVFRMDTGSLLEGMETHASYSMGPQQP